MKKGNVLIINKKVITDAIVLHYEAYGVYWFLDEKKTEFEAKFDAEICGQKYKGTVIYFLCKNRWIMDRNSVLLTGIDGKKYQLKDESLYINPNSINPNSLTYSEEMDNITEREELKREENEREAKKERQHQDWLRRNII